MSRVKQLADMLRDALLARRRGQSSTRTVNNRELDDLLAQLERKRKANEEEFDDVELTGRGASHDRDEWQAIATNRRLVNSSNVYAYHFIPEKARSGILYVTFLNWEQGMKSEDRSGPGSTYAYYDFPIAKYNQFEAASAESAGRAVWDYCRVRGPQSSNSPSH